jgi:phosphoglycerol transferase MdoB-like AlkP superfamily enzyme
MKKIITLSALALLVCIMDILYPSNGFICILTGLISSYILFHLAASGFQPDRRKTLLLLAVNILLFLLTFRFKVYLLNMVMLSYLVWAMITPTLTKYRHTLHISLTAACLSIYLCSLFGINIPLFPIVFFPAYWIGCKIKTMKFKSMKTARGIALGNTFIAVSLLGALLYNVLGLQIIDSMSYLRFIRTGTQTAVYLPLITVFYLWFSCSINFLLYTFSKEFKKSVCPDTGVQWSTLSARATMFAFARFFVFILCLILIGEYALRGDIRTALKYLLAPRTMYNTLFLSTLYLVLITLVGRGLSAVILTFCTLLVAFANYMKMRYFNEPFYPWDLYLLRSALSISKHYITIKVVIILLLSLAAAVFVIARHFTWIKNAVKPRLTLYILPVTAILVMTNMMILDSIPRLSDVSIQKSWYVGKAEVLANGFFVQNYFYLTDLDKYLHSKPPEYSREKMEQISRSLTEKTIEQTTGKGKPNIIVLMSESFWDPTQLKGLSFSKDITQNLKKYQKGEIISPAVGGSTANVEFEALTGLSMYFMNPGILTYNVYLRRDTPSIASVMKEAGYRTIAVHPNAGWFYNRDKVYDFLGFQDFFDLESFNLKEDAKGPHVSDEKLVEKILSLLNEGDEPKFIFAVSMQNHDPYQDKYKDLEVEAKSDKLNASETALMSGYAQGILDADRALGKLIDTLDKSGTPTLVYFFGDHLPRMGSLQGMYDIYNRLNPLENAESPQSKIRFYRTPYASWSNYKEMKPFHSPVSPTHITYEILQDSRVKYPPYFEILNQVGKKFPYLHKQLSGKKDIQNELLNDYKLIQYDLLFGEQYLQSMKK